MAQRIMVAFYRRHHTAAPTWDELRTVEQDEFTTMATRYATILTAHPDISREEAARRLCATYGCNADDDATRSYFTRRITEMLSPRFTPRRYQQ